MRETSDLEPRKLPRQARSSVTVDAILQATMELLKKNDDGGASTTRIALRAGVSVGTLYQYFPNQNSLRYAVLQRHLGGLATALEHLCARARSKPLALLAQDFTDGYTQLKIARQADRWALRDHIAELGMEQAKSAVFTRAGQALGDVLLSAPDARFLDAHATAAALLRDMYAITMPTLSRCRDAALVDRLRGDLGECVRHHMGVAGAQRDPIEMRID